MIDEKALNQGLGRALRRRRRAWGQNGTLLVEPLGCLQSRGQPDILIAEPARDPVILETEVAPAATVERDAQARLGVKTLTGDTVHTAIAVRLPETWRTLGSDAALDRAVERDELEWAIWMDNGGSPRRWPAGGWIAGNVSLLTFAAYESTLGHHRIDAAATALSSAVLAAGKKLAQMERDGYQAALNQIASVLLQKPNEQTWGMAALILANALIFHDLLAGRGNLSHVHDVGFLEWKQGGQLRKTDVLTAWDEIYKVNYWPIFESARRILGHIPDAYANAILQDLHRAASDAGLHSLLPSHDLLSHTFQRLITDRKKLASFYTLPETAALLSALAITQQEGLAGHPWDDAEGLKSVVIADYACGTGTLLAAAYRRMCWLHEAAGGNPEELHATWMAQSLWGADVLPAAAHLTATILSGVYATAHYGESRVYVAPYGVRQPSTKEWALGSLDLLEEQSRFQGFLNLGAQITAEGSKVAEFEPRDVRADLCIMNPPYTRNTNHEGERASDLLPAFAAFGLEASIQKAMAKRLKELTHPTFAHGNAGIASAFLAVAHLRTKDNGKLAMVLPLTFLSGSSWSMARSHLAKYYTDLIAVTISGVYTRESGFSSDTDMAECLIIARKARPKHEGRVLMVSLDQRPTDPLAATLLAERITAIVTNGTVPRLEDAPYGGAEIRLGNDRLGIMLSVPSKWGPGWIGGRIADYALAQTAYHLARGVAWLPGTSQQHDVPTPMTAIDNLGELGPLHRDINGNDRDKRGRRRGPFDIVSLIPGEVPTYPVIWQHNASGETTLQFAGDHKGIPREDADAGKLGRVWAKASHLHLNLDWRFNSQPLQAQWTPTPSLGGPGWPSFVMDERDAGKATQQAIALLLWLNSTPGILVRWLWSNRQQNGRGRMTREVLPDLPVLDVSSLSESRLERCEELFSRLKYETLLPLHLLPRDETRARLDRGLLHEILDWPEEWFEPHNALDLVRRKLAAEPSVHGHKHGRITP